MNMKNIKEKIARKINKQSLKTFFQKQGLYVLIFLCVVAAGITAIIAWPRDNAGDQMSDSNTDAAVIEAPSLEDELAAKNSQTPTAAPTPTASPTAQAGDDSQPVTANGGGSITLKKPVDGPVINSFSGDELVYFASLNMWATHNGIDLKAENGASVVAARSGTVSEVYTNESDGGVIVITHSDTTKTLYAGLGEMSVEVDDKVNAGQQIGKIGEMPRELDLSYHLHFEYIVDGTWKDPAKYFG